MTIDKRIDGVLNGIRITQAGINRPDLHDPEYLNELHTLLGIYQERLAAYRRYKHSGKAYAFMD